MRSCIKRHMKGLTAKVSGPQNAGPLDRRVRPEGQKGAPSLEDVRGPRKSAGPRKRRSAARRIAGGACCTSAGGQKGFKPLRTGRSAGRNGCAHRAFDGTNVQNHGLPKAVPCIEKLGGLGKVGHKLNRTRNPKSTAPLFILVTRLARENQNRHCALLLL